MVSETMNLHENFLESIKNEKSEVWWDGAMKNIYILGAGRRRNLQRRQKKGDQVGWRQGERAQKPKERISQSPDLR